MKKVRTALSSFSIAVFAVMIFTSGCSNLFSGNNGNGGNNGNAVSLPDDTSALIAQADAGCPCELPENETSPLYALSESDKSALAEYKTRLQDKLLDSRDSRLQQALSYQTLYQKARNESDKTAEEYMKTALGRIDENKGTMSIEGLNEMRVVLTANIDELNYIVSEFEEELDPVFYAFSGAELKLLIQARKLVIDEIASRQ
jgi:hypothetical protein